MNKDDQKPEFIEQVQARLDQSEQQIDPITLGRLRAARREAMAVKRRPIWQWPAATFATLALCAVLVNGLMQAPDEMPASVDLFEDVVLLSAQDELEMYEELDLLLWLLEEEENGLG